MLGLLRNRASVARSLILTFKGVLCDQALCLPFHLGHPGPDHHRLRPGRAAGYARACAYRHARAYGRAHCGGPQSQPHAATDGYALPHAYALGNAYAYLYSPTYY